MLGIPKDNLLSIRNHGRIEKIHRVSTKYVTWRSQNDNQQFPTGQSGQSLDLWSEDLYTDIAGNATWQDLIDHVPYDLSTNKTSLYYNYSPPYPEQFNQGGTIAFTFVTPP